MARSYRDVESAQIPLAEAVREAAHGALSLLAMAGGAVPAAAGDEPNHWQFEQSGPTGTRFQISCIGPTLPTTIPAEVIRPAEIAKDRPFVGTWRVVIKAPILVLDIYWQAGKPLRIMTFANGDWQQELSHLAGDARKEKHCTTDRRGSTIMPRIRTLPENPTLMDLRAKYASLFELLRPYGQQLMRGPSPLTPGQRELIAAYTSATNACRYCHGVHTLVAEGLGVDPAVLDKLWTDIGSAPVEERMKPLLSYARKLTEAPSQVSDADADAVYTAGWSEEALVHTIAVCAYFNQMNRLVEGAGIVGSPERYAANAKTLVALGYQR